MSNKVNGNNVRTISYLFDQRVQIDKNKQTTQRTKRRENAETINPANHNDIDV